jgi:DNA-binding transcriptional LysR family regulator
MLHLSQPAISYTIAKMEEQLGVPLLKLEGRKAQVTDQASALLERSRALLQEASELEKFAQTIRESWRPEVQVAVDRSFPQHTLIAALHAFSRPARSAKISLLEGSTLKIESVLKEGTADLVISSSTPSELQGDVLMETQYVPVAHPDHPLAKLKRTVGNADLEGQVEVIFNHEMADRIHGVRPNSANTRVWEVASLERAIAVVCEGFGYTWAPRHRIEKWLEDGKLAVLDLEDSETAYKMKFYLIYGRSSVPTSEANRFSEVLRSVASTAEN